MALLCLCNTQFNSSLRCIAIDLDLFVVIKNATAHIFAR